MKIGIDPILSLSPSLPRLLDVPQEGFILCQMGFRICVVKVVHTSSSELPSIDSFLIAFSYTWITL